VAYLSEIPGISKAPGAKRAGYYTNYYTNALRKRLFHSCNRSILKAGKHMVEVEDFDYSYRLYTADMVARMARFAEGLMGYRE
jgi:hypothetical protein